jgi:hypothetical protein
MLERVRRYARSFNDPVERWALVLAAVAVAATAVLLALQLLGR